MKKTIIAIVVASILAIASIVGSNRAAAQDSPSPIHSNGKLVLTEPDGTRHEFTPGQSLVVPKGYTGTWEQVGTYRELAIIASSQN